MAPAAGSAALGFVTVLALGSVDGGFFPESWRWAAVGLAAAAAISLLLRGRFELPRAAAATAAGFGLFAAWVALSGLWADDRALALLEAERALVYLLGAAAAAVVVTRRTAPHLLAGVLAAAAALTVYSLVGDGRADGSLEGPIGYANALGILAAIGILLAAGLARAEQRTPVRVLLAITVLPLAVALVLTGSRGSVVALAAGAAVALVLASRIRLVLAGAAVAALGTLAVVLTGRGARVFAGDRPEYWRVAWSQFEERPLSGAGAGAFHGYWLDHRPDPSTLHTPDVLDAHSLYVETLAELGVVGLALVVAALGIPLGEAIRRRHDPVVAAATPAYAAFVVHAGLDWDWEMPAVTLAGIFCGMAVLASASNGSGGARRNFGFGAASKWAHPSQRGERGWSSRGS